jgi:hypothetical protein
MAVNDGPNVQAGVIDGSMCHGLTRWRAGALCDHVVIVVIVSKHTNKVGWADFWDPPGLRATDKKLSPTRSGSPRADAGAYIAVAGAVTCEITPDGIAAEESVAMRTECRGYRLGGSASGAQIVAILNDSFACHEGIVAGTVESSLAL